MTNEHTVYRLDIDSGSTDWGLFTTNRSLVDQLQDYGLVTRTDGYGGEDLKLIEFAIREGHASKRRVSDVDEWQWINESRLR